MGLRLPCATARWRDGKAATQELPRQSQIPTRSPVRLRPQLKLPGRMELQEGADSSCRRSLCCLLRLEAASWSRPPVRMRSTPLPANFALKITKDLKTARLVSIWCASCLCAGTGRIQTASHDRREWREIGSAVLQAKIISIPAVISYFVWRDCLKSRIPHSSRKVKGGHRTPLHQASPSHATRLGCVRVRSTASKGQRACWAA